MTFHFNFKFFGRENELKQLHNMYHKDGFSFACIYGRRRVGKSSLIRQFISETNSIHISFTAIEHNDAANLKEFSKKALEVFPKAKSFITSFETWESVFEYIYNESKNDKIIVFIDEYPYIAQGNRSISSIIQKYIDDSFSRSNIKLILCGSSMSFMLNQVLGYESPLYGRRTLQMEIKPFNYIDTSKMASSYSLEEKVLLYAVTGGIPYYVNSLKQSENLEKDIINAFFNTTGALYEEPNNLLKQELREPALYNSIITSIATGNTQLNNISSGINEDQKKVSKYINTLINLHIIEKEYQIIHSSKRKGIYKIKDNMYKFWYRFVPLNTTNIENGIGIRIYELRVKPQLPIFLGYIFKDICIQYMKLCNAREMLLFLFNNIGRWWGGNPETKQEEEIDIIAYNDKNIIFGECKYREDLMDIPELYKLIKKSKILKENKNIFYYLFSKSGFTKQLHEKVRLDDSIKLINLNDIYNM